MAQVRSLIQSCIWKRDDVEFHQRIGERWHGSSPGQFPKTPPTTFELFRDNYKCRRDDRINTTHSSRNIQKGTELSWEEKDFRLVNQASNWRTHSIQKSPKNDPRLGDGAYRSFHPVIIQLPDVSKA
ncbi:hypothetical protein TNIN_380591 [Trichonephila inaurata madagascariensis]|uniref:Uncharacterized protein n=1 Tax=Trichonephila inaurata madagascariensis TaxID=2747483 RepID=A0A8X6JB17_9ARAC|nr:hypothetical protein TNIN_380591 [Trichonephila inaurata madagascariensis]